MNTFTQAYRTTRIPKASRLNTVIPREYVGRKLEITIIPFEEEPEYNAETLEALQEARDIIAGKIKVKSYKTVEEMDADIEAEEDDGD